MTDPVQVVAERCESCGALLRWKRIPADQRELCRHCRCWSTDVQTWRDGLLRRPEAALLQKVADEFGDLLKEVRVVLGLHRRRTPPQGRVLCGRCERLWPCPEAALLQKIDQAVAS